MSLVNLDPDAPDGSFPRLRVSLQNLGRLELVVAIQSSADGINWSILRVNRIPIPADFKERR
jgi:hypothetical protein